MIVIENIIVYSKENPMPENKFKILFEIMEKSFPAEEHGSKRLHCAELLKKEFRCMCYEPQGVPVGFMNYYEFREENLIFLEHFAVNPDIRGNGLGSRLMEHFKEICSPLPIVLEVEPPENEIERRRIEFYKRMGFVLNEGEYFQPPFTEGCPDVPLKLMSTLPLGGDNFKKAADLIHQKVYFTNKKDSC